MTLLGRLQGGVVISCQSQSPRHPLSPPSSIARLAASAELGGAVAVRIDHPRNVAASRRAVDVPVIGLYKQRRSLHRSIITPTFERAAALVAAGADVLAVEAVARTGVPAARATEVLTRVVAELDRPVMADVSTFDEGIAAWQAGAALVGTTLSGYTPQSPRSPEPDLDLVARLAQAGVRTVAEGRFRTADQVAQAFAAGAFAVVVGTAATDPVSITRWLVEVSPRARQADG
jgi:N-acylglucosamine-6-phosphate 2-epimerase